MVFECTARVLVLHRNFSSVPTYFEREVMAMEGHDIPWWEPFFKVMCYMDGMCFAMLTPMLYISVCRKICGVIRGKGLAHVLMVSSIALD